jgi:hypothetical protein
MMTYCRHRASNDGNPCASCLDKRAEHEWITTFANDPFARWREHKRMKEALEFYSCKDSSMIEQTKHFEGPEMLAAQIYYYGTKARFALGIK